MAHGVIQRFDQLDAGLRARLSPTGELRSAVGVLSRVAQRVTPVDPPVAPTPAGPAATLVFSNPEAAAIAALVQLAQAQ